MDGTGPDAFMHIGEVAERTDLSLRSLRHWEEVGLLQPSARTDGGFRLYTEADVDKILVIRRMKPLGFSLEQMKGVMRDLEALDASGVTQADRVAVRSRLDAVRAEATERRAALVRQLEMADEFIALVDAQVD
jgi:MerR family transcriptional regulator, copper efflux regulator